MPKKMLPVVVIVIGVISLLGLFFFIKSRSSQTQQTEETKVKKKLSLPEVELSQAPYVLIKPVDSRNISIVVNSMKKSAAEMDYELEYQAGSLLQGAFGLVELNSLPYTEKILLGSCSAGGSCTYHENVQGGTLLARFTGGEEDYQKKSEWKYIENKSDTEFSSKDAKFQINSDDLKSEKILVIFNGFGYPDGMTGEADSSPYTITGTSELEGTATLTIRAKSEDATKIVGYDGKQWHDFETEKDGKMLTAEVDLMTLYMASK